LASIEIRNVLAASFALNLVVLHSTLPSAVVSSATQWRAVNTRFWVSSVPEQAE